ncbi:MAG TPA: hypothetical protein VII39_03990 [Bradyrhizobium sp.]
MPLAGQGMLLTSMDVAPEHEADFNRWYDSEHLEERVAIDGFLEARRYVAHAASPKYLCLYSTRTLQVLNSDTDRARLANPTEWSRQTMAHFQNMIRAVARITVSRGVGRGAVLGIVRLRPPAERVDNLRTELTAKLDPTGLDGIISIHLIESDAALSGPTAELPAAAGASDWFVLIDGTEANAISTVMTAHFIGGATPIASMIVSSGLYTLMWDLTKADIGSR